MRPTLLSLALLLSVNGFAQDAPKPSYTEPLRPQLHFSPRRHWMNDPNGLVFFAGEYHLFFQYNPFGDTPGHISWGHAVSADLLHWHELPVAIPAIPGPHNELVFTGSVVIDERNTSGLCAHGTACMVAIYTAHHDRTAEEPENHEAQALAVSQDHGRTWIRYAGNPVLDLHLPEFRDPGVTWSNLTHSWLMVVSLPRTDQVAFFTSPNLKDWTRLTTFGPAGMSTQLNPRAQWECPNLLEVPSATPGKPSLYALKVGLNPGSLQGGSGEQYFLGAFDGHTFTPSALPGAHGWTDYGKDSYCAISYNHLPAGDKPTLIGWMDNWQYADKVPTSPWRGQMTIPRRLSYVSDAAGLSLKEDPVVAPLRTGPATTITADIKPEVPITFDRISVPSELSLVFSHLDGSKESSSFGLRIYTDSTHFVEILFDRANSHLVMDRTHSPDLLGQSLPDFPARTEAPLVPTRPYDLQIIFDRSSLELFAQGHTIAMTDLVDLSAPPIRVELFTRGNTAPIHVTGQTVPLRSVWTDHLQ